MPGYDAIVLGVGTMGAAACLALARRGLKVLGLEQFDIPNTFGSHHGHSRMFRMAYYEHADYVPLLRRSFELWQGLQAESGEELFQITGALYMGCSDGELVRGSTASARTHGLTHELLEASAIRRAFPQFRIPDDFAGLHEPQAGFVNPELAVTVMAAEAIKKGAEIRSRVPVVRWRCGPGGVEVDTGEGVAKADRLIVTAGAWSGPILAELGLPLTVTRQVVGWVSPRLPDLFGRDVFPCWGIQSRNGELFYGFPLDPGHGLKLARHALGQVSDPARIDREPNPSDEETFRPGLRQYLPDADGLTLSMSVCMYTNSPDSHFIIDRHPVRDGVAFACGFSGHGFKFAPVVGEALADLAIHGRSDLPIGFLGLGRFGGAQCSGS